LQYVAFFYSTITLYALVAIIIPCFNHVLIKKAATHQNA